MELRGEANGCNNDDAVSEIGGGGGRGVKQATLILPLWWQRSFVLGHG